MVPKGVWILAAFGIAWLVVTIPIIWITLTSKGATPSFEFHWGGLGRGLGGWNVSWSLVLALAWLILTFGSVAVAMEVLTPPAAQGPATVPSGSKLPQSNPKPDATTPTTNETTPTDNQKGGE